MNKKIYILSIYKMTGGPQSLHQLASVLKKSGENASIFYCNENGEILKNNKPLYSKYELCVSDDVPDEEESLIVVPETYIFFLRKYVKAKKIIWWLSLDYYLRKSPVYRAKHTLYINNLSSIFFPLAVVKQFISKKNVNADVTVDMLKSCFHLYNCNYVRNYLLECGIKENEMHYLCGPIDEDIINAEWNKIKNIKKDIVAISTNKNKINRIFVKRIKESLRKNDNIEVICIDGMPKQQVYKTFSKAKIYCDFGFFPGPERLPREAAALYCNVITSNVGSAANDEDILIFSKYKISPKNRNVSHVVKMIYYLMDHYTDKVGDYSDYRGKIRKQFERFESDISEIFNQEL